VFILDEEIIQVRERKYFKTSFAKSKKAFIFALPS
jgi:hypothetical protein